MGSTIQVTIVGDSSKLSSAFRSAASSADAFGSSLGGKVTSGLMSVGKFAVAAGGALGGALVAGAVVSLKKFAEFETALNEFQAVAGATGDEMEQVSDHAKDLGNDLTLPGTSAKDAALAMTELAKGGLSVEDSMDAAQAAIQLSTAAQVDNAHAAEIMADALNSFGLEGEDAAMVADLLANAANATTASIDDMALALKASSAVAAQLGIPIDDLTTALGLMANAGIKGSDAGTSVKTMLLSLAAPTDKAAAAMKELGFQVFDAHGKMLPLPALIDNWRTATEGMTQAQEIAAMKTIFGTDAIRAAATILGSEKGKWDDMATAMDKQGSAAELAAAKSKGLAGAWDGLKSALETGAITIGEKLAPAVEDIVRFLGDFFSKLSDAKSASEAFDIILEGVQQLAGKVRDAIADLVDQIDWGAVRDKAGELFKAFTGLVQDVDWAGIAKGMAELLGKAIPPAFSAIAETFKEIFTGIGEAIGQAIDEPLTRWARGAVEFVANALAEVATVAGDALGNIANVLDPILIGSPFQDAADDMHEFAGSMEDAAERARNFKTEGEKLEEAMSQATSELNNASTASQNLVEKFKGLQGAVPVSDLDSMAEALIRTQGQVKLTDAATAVLIATYGRVPTKVETQALLDDPAARAKLTDWVAQINKTPGTVETRAEMLSEGAKKNANELKSAIDAIPERTKTHHDSSGGSTVIGTAGSIAAAVRNIPTSWHTTHTISTNYVPGVSPGPGFQSGGRVPWSGMFMVGERGRELVALPEAARVFNNRETEHMLMGGGRRGGGVAAPVINVYVSGPVTSRRDFAAEVRDALLGGSMLTPSLWSGR